MKLLKFNTFNYENIINVNMLCFSKTLKYVLNCTMLEQSVLPLRDDQSRSLGTRTAFAT